MFEAFGVSDDEDVLLGDRRGTAFAARDWCLRSLGGDGGEIMSMIEIAMMGNLKYTALRDAVLAHPAYAESLNNLFSNFVNESK